MCTHPHSVRDLLCCPPQVHIRDFYRRTRGPDLMGNCSTLPYSKPSPKRNSNFCKTSCSQMTQLSYTCIKAHSAEELQQLMSRFSEAYKHFGLIISLKKTQVMGQGVPDPPEITISNHQLEVVHDFVNLGSTISDTLSLDTELNRRIGKASTTMSRLTKRVWKNGKLTENTKIQIYRACMLSTLLYGSESWTLHALHEHKLNTFHLRKLRRILNITWQDKVPNTEVLDQEQIGQACTCTLDLPHLWKGLSFKNRPFQSQQTMLPVHNSIV